MRRKTRLLARLCRIRCHRSSFRVQDDEGRGGPPPRPAAASDLIEVSLARALADATNAGRFDLAEELVGELRARRKACS